MRRYLPLTLLLLAALSGPAFGASEQWRDGQPDLRELVRLVQSDNAIGLTSSARSAGLSVLAPGLTVLVWLSDADCAALASAGLAAPAPPRAQLRRSSRPEELPAAGLRMRPPVLRGP